MQTKVIHKRKRTFWPWLIFVIIAIFLLGCWNYAAQQNQAVDINDTTYKIVTIPANSGARQIAEILKQEDLIRSERVFLNYLSSQGLDSRLKAGNYKFSRSQTMEEITNMIVAGQVENISFTIPEGYTLKEMGELLAGKGLVTEQEWEEALLKDYELNFLEDIPLDQENRLEGLLFPDTYHVTAHDNGEKIVAMMLKRFAEIWDKEFSAQAALQGISVLEAVTIASLIEREAAVPEERKTISGVIANRLKIGMPLQIDATILYSLKQHKELVTNADLKVASPYNTYTHTGLPPGPIAAPGMAALEAALDPEKHSYYYYVSRGDGTHEFTNSFAEHLQAINKYN